MHRLLKYCKSTGKPFCLLLPNYVYMKEYYKPALGDLPMFYIVPNKRYLYTTPYVSVCMCMGVYMLNVYGVL